MAQVGSRSAPSTPLSRPGDPPGRAAEPAPMEKQIWVHECCPTLHSPSSKGWPGWIAAPPRTGGLFPLPVTDLAAAAAGSGLPGPPASSHEPPRPRCPPEARSALLGLPGKQLLFCSSLVLARAVAGSAAASLLHQGLAVAVGLSSAQDVPPSQRDSTRASPASQARSCCLCPWLAPALAQPATRTVQDRPRHTMMDVQTFTSHHTLLQPGPCAWWTSTSPPPPPPSATRPGAAAKPSECTRTEGLTLTASRNGCDFVPSSL